MALNAIPAASLDGADFVGDLAAILCIAALTTVLFQRLRQPVVLGYLLAGLIVGPHLPIPLFASEQVAHSLSELGVILLMFSLGLEFSVRRLVKVGPTAGLVAVIQCSLLFWLGYTVARLFGWTGIEGLFTGALIAISSTTIIIKAFAEERITGRLAEVVFGVLIVEDLIAVLLLALLTAVSTGVGLSGRDLLLVIAKLSAFLLGVMAFGMLLIPRLVRAIARLERDETLVVALIGICCGVSLLARWFGYSVALGAFLAGALVAESGKVHTLERLVAPLRDVFAAVFFVSVGMLIDPHQLAIHWLPVLVLTAVVVLGKLAGVTVGSFVSGGGVPLSVRAGMSLAQIGEFSFIIAGLGASLGVTRGFLYPIAVAVSAVTTLTTPILIRVSLPFSRYVDRKLPRRVQTFSALYGAWIARIGLSRPGLTARRHLRRLALRLLVDIAAIATIVVTAALIVPRVRAVTVTLTWLPRWTAPLVVSIAGVVIALPFTLGAVRLARAIALHLALRALPTSGGVDLSGAPRRALLVTLQMTILLAAGMPIMTVTEPFLPTYSGPIVLIGLLLVFMPAFWRSAAHLEAHVRAGAQVVLERLMSESRTEDGGHVAPTAHESPSTGTARDDQWLQKAFADAEAIPLSPNSPAIGRSLGEIELRGRSAATVVAIRRPSAGLVHPDAETRLLRGDVLVIMGTAEARGVARELLEGGARTDRLPAHVR